MNIHVLHSILWNATNIRHLVLNQEQNSSPLVKGTYRRVEHYYVAIYVKTVFGGDWRAIVERVRTSEIWDEEIYVSVLTPLLNGYVILGTNCTSISIVK